MKGLVKFRILQNNCDDSIGVFHFVGENRVIRVILELVLGLLVSFR